MLGKAPSPSKPSFYTVAFVTQAALSAVVHRPLLGVMSWTMSAGLHASLHMVTYLLHVLQAIET